ncbi:MAG: hypothetical protein ACR2IA_07520 [Pyrinomonadaceae bacterium]
MYRKLFLPVLLILFVQISFSQTIEIKTETKTETKDEIKLSAELKKQAVEFLRESAGEVGNLRTLENRISFASEMAGLMWFHDEKEARAMMNAVVGDFKQLLVQYDSQINASGIELGGDEHYYGGFLGGGDQSDKARLMRKLAKAMSVRQQMTLSIAEHDPQYALDFYTGSLLTFSNPQVRKRFEEQDKYFEARLVNEIAAKDAGKALELGRKSLAKGLNYGHIELLKKIYEKDADKGAVFAEEIAGKLKDGKVGADDFYMLGATLKLGADNYEKAKKDNKKPMFTEQHLRDLAELTAQGVLKRADSSEGRVSEYLGSIEKYAPSRAVQIRAKAAAKTQRGTDETDGIRVVSNGIATSVPAPPMRAVPTGGQNEKNEQEEMMKSLQTLGKKELPKEQREKVIARARKIIAATPNRQQKILALSALAAQVSKLGDKELADEIMKDAQSLLVSAPKNYQDFMEVWMVASGFAQTDAEKAFPVLDDTIFRLNDTISAFVKVGEFIDLSGEMIEDGEVQVGGFGGSMVRELTRGLGAAAADATILGLAKSDFTKTKALTNKFERQEVRILAKMLVLRAILGDKKKPTEEN